MHNEKERCSDRLRKYQRYLTTVFENVSVYAVCDLDGAKAKEKAEQYHTKVMSLPEILADENVDIVLNLTTPSSHYEICKKAILAKKNTYVEKPLSATYAEGRELVALAREKGVLLGCAPDTFMGAGIHTARSIIDHGLIGDIVGAAAFMLCNRPRKKRHRHEQLSAQNTKNHKQPQTRHTDCRCGGNPCQRTFTV